MVCLICLNRFAMTLYHVLATGSVTQTGWILRCRGHRGKHLNGSTPSFRSIRSPCHGTRGGSVIVTKSSPDLAGADGSPPESTRAMGASVAIVSTAHAAASKACRPSPARSNGRGRGQRSIPASANQLDPEVHFTPPSTRSNNKCNQICKTSWTPKSHYEPPSPKSAPDTPIQRSKYVKPAGPYSYTTFQIQHGIRVSIER